MSFLNRKKSLEDESTKLIKSKSNIIFPTAIGGANQVSGMDIPKFTKTGLMLT